MLRPIQTCQGQKMVPAEPCTVPLYKWPQPRLRAEGSTPVMWEGFSSKCSGILASAQLRDHHCNNTDSISFSFCCCREFRLQTTFLSPFFSYNLVLAPSALWLPGCCSAGPWAPLALKQPHLAPVPLHRPPHQPAPVSARG